MTEILRRTTADGSFHAGKTADGPTIEAMGKLARQVPIASHVSDYVVRLVLATHPENEQAVPIVKRTSGTAPAPVAPRRSFWRQRSGR